MNTNILQVPPQRSSRRRETQALLPASIEALKAATVPLILEQLQRMFERADDALFEMSERPGTDRDRRVYFDAMRHIRLHRARMMEAFHAELLDGFAAPDAGPPEADEAIAGELSLQSDDVLEENLAQAHVVTRAENLYQTVLWELDRRLAQQPASVSPQALSPQHICDAFRSCHADIELDLRVRLILYKLFEHAAIIGLGAVYAVALEVLDAHGVKAPAANGRRAEGLRAEACQDSASGFDAPLPPSPVLDPLTLEALQSLLRAAPGHASGPVVRQGPLPDPFTYGRAPVQRLSLAGQLFNDVFADTYAPEALRETFDRFRQPLARIALGDARFFSDSQHPVRTLLDEAASVVASARVADSESVGALAARLHQIAADIEGMGLGTEPDLHVANGISLSEVAAFLEHQRAQARARRAATIQGARQSVAEEMESRLKGRHIPEAASPFLQSAVAPVMGLQLLRHGKTSQAWNSALENLVRLIDLLDFDADRKSAETDRAAFLGHIRAELLAAGMSQTRTDEAIASLRKAFEERDAETPESPLLKADTWVAEAAAAPAPPPRSAAETAPAPSGASNGRRASVEEMGALEALVRVDRYFSIYDPGRGYTRWLRVWGFYREAQYIAFASFEERPVLSLAAGRFIDDLVAHRTTPCDPSPAETAALAALAGLRIPPTV